MQHSPKLRARKCNAKTKKLVKRVHKYIKSKLTPKADDYRVHRGSEKNLESFLLARVEKNAAKVWKHALDEDWL